MSRHSTFLCWFLEEEDTQLKMLQDAGKKNYLKFQALRQQDLYNSI